MRIFLYTDGGVRTGGVRGPTGGKSGPGSIGYVVRDEAKKILERGGMFLPDTTVNEAEYSAVICGLAACIRLGLERITVRSDSQLVVNQLNGKWAVKAIHLRDYIEDVREAASQFEEVLFEWVPREQNQLADSITREIMAERST